MRRDDGKDTSLDFITLCVLNYDDSLVFSKVLKRAGISVMPVIISGGGGYGFGEVVVAGGVKMRVFEEDYDAALVLLRKFQDAKRRKRADHSVEKGGLSEKQTIILFITAIIAITLFVAYERGDFWYVLSLIQGWVSE